MFVNVDSVLPGHIFDVQVYPARTEAPLLHEQDDINHIMMTCMVDASGQNTFKNWSNYVMWGCLLVFRHEAQHVPTWEWRKLYGNFYLRITYAAKEQEFRFVLSMVFSVERTNGVAAGPFVYSKRYDGVACSKINLGSVDRSKEIYITDRLLGSLDRAVKNGTYELRKYDNLLYKFL